MEEWGNGRANAYYEASIPREYIRPKENDPVRVIERFIRDKYEHKRFLAKSLPPPRSEKPEDDAGLDNGKSKANKNVKNTSAPARQPVAAPVAPAPAPVVESNLLDFMDTPPPNPPLAPSQPPQPPIQVQQPQPQAAFSQGFSDFGPAPTFSGAAFWRSGMVQVIIVVRRVVTKEC